GVDGAGDQAGRQPGAAGDLRGRPEADPQIRGQGETEQGSDEVDCRSAIRAHPVARKCREVGAHERDERSEVEHLGPKPKGENQPARSASAPSIGGAYLFRDIRPFTRAWHWI